MNSKFNAAADTVLDYTVNRFGGAPGVVAMATDASAISTRAPWASASWARTSR